MRAFQEQCAPAFFGLFRPKGHLVHSGQMGKLQTLLVINPPLRKIRSIVSEGVLFDIDYAEGITPVLATSKSPVADGVRGGWGSLCG